MSLLERRMQLKNVIFMIAATACLYTVVSAATNEFMIPENTGCVCSGTRLTYNCTITGTGNTEWSGTLFNCPANGIILRHERFPSEDVIGECNGGAVMARELGFLENCYTSELSFVANPSFNNKTVSCIHNANEGDIIIGTSILSVEGSYPPPKNITLSRVYQRMLTFKWSLSVPNCSESSLSYGITFDCGSCPQTTNTTSVTCSGVQLPPNESTCEFIVHTIVCENAGLSNSLTVNFIAPDEPIVEIVPIYSGDKEGVLIGIMTIVNQRDRFNSTATDNMAGIVESYNTYIDSTMVANNASCSVDECQYTANVSSSLCDSSSSVGVAIRAANSVGQSPTSNPSVIACRNQFVSIDYNSTTSTITCRFRSHSEGSQNTCSGHSGQCTALEQSVNASESSFNTSFSANVTLHIIDLGDSISTYCVTATNGTYEIMVEVRLNQETQGGQPTTALIIIIVPVVVATVIFLLVVVSVVCCCCYCRRRDLGGTPKDHYIKLEDFQSERFSKSDFQRLKKDMRPHDTNDSKLMEILVDKYCSIKELLGFDFHRGHVFYQFSSDVETITRDKLLIFKTEDGGYYFLNADMDEKLHGERVLKPDLNNCVVFVQSTGLGLRCLPPNTKIIYEQLNPHPMWRVDKDQYEMKKIPRGYSVKQYCEDHRHSLVQDYKKGSVFVEHDSEGDRTESTIIAREVQGKEVWFTGSQTRSTVDGSSGAIESKKVLMLMANEHEEFKKDTVIWYQIPNVTIIEGVTLIPIKSEQFKHAILKEKQKLKDFQKQHHLHANELNVLVEIGWNELEKHAKHKKEVLDTILMHSSKDGERYFFGNFDMLLSHRQKLSDGVQDEWKLFVMYKFDENFHQRKNFSILYQPEAWEPNGLLRIPDYSKHFTTKPVQEQTTLGKFFENQHDLKRSNTHVFVNVNSVPRNTIHHVRDVILMNRTGPKGVLFSGPYARNLVKKWSSGRQESDASELDQQLRDRWDIYVLSNDVDDKLTFTSSSSILYLKHDNPKQQFEVHEVEEDTIQLSQFLKDKGLPPHYGKVYYELVGDPKHAVEDFLYYKEVVLLKKPKKRGLTLRKANTEFPVNGMIVDCEFHSFYKLHKEIPHMEVEVKLNSDTKYFIQSLSQGSRCLKRGEFVLIMKQ